MAPLVIAHRGGAPELGENSAAAFDRAVSGPADMLETDVQQSADGTLIIRHDDVLTLADGTRKAIRNMTYSELVERLPDMLTLDEFLESWGRKRPTNIDVKRNGFEDELLAAIRRHGVSKSVLVSSTWGRTLRHIRLRAPAIACGLSRGQIVSWVGTETRSRIAAMMMRPTMPMQLAIHGRFALAGAVMLQYGLVNPWLVRQLQRQGFRVFCWTINDPNIAKNLAEMGVDGIATDTPEAIAPVVRSVIE
jgi:glycerophosphoryl diester phosphodiesterase